MSFDLSFIVYILLVTLIAIILLHRYRKYASKRSRQLHWIAAVGLILIGACVYFFPFGAIDAYEATKMYFNFDYVQNSLLWYGICAVLGIFGVLLLKFGLKKRRK